MEERIYSKLSRRQSSQGLVKESYIIVRDFISCLEAGAKSRQELNEHDSSLNSHGLECNSVNTGLLCRVQLRH